MNRNEEQINKALRDYDDIEIFKSSRAYGLIIEPTEKELERLKYAYECKTTQEMATLKGKKAGLSFPIEEIERITRDGERAREDQVVIERKRKMDKIELDSTDL